MAHVQMKFPADFLWGTATAAYQVEGNNTNSDWWPWEQEPGRILNDQRSGLACDWWHNAEADLDLAADMGTNAHRLSLEWSRIEPEPSKFDTAALDRYREILQAMHQRGIEPLVTLHHFSNPLWLVEKGDFNSQIVVDYFRRYVAQVLDTFGELVPKWITINEPMVYVFMRYVTGTFPAPQKKGFWASMEAVKHLLQCHAAAYHLIKERFPEASVGVAKNFPVFESKSGSIGPGKLWSSFLNSQFNKQWMQAMVTGRLPALSGRGKIPHLADSFDFVGVNYYTRYYVKFPTRNGYVETDWGPEAIVSDGNYGEVYPAGLFKVIQQVLPYHKPILITENGLPDAADRLRPSFIITHLREIWRAINFCFPIMGYYHWSLIDNFEWDRGWTQRFGLIAMDPETQVRTLRRSGKLYRDICWHGCISSEMAEAYAPELLHTLFPGSAPVAALDK